MVLSKVSRKEKGMALYVNLPAYPQYILPDLLDITDNDGGIGDDIGYDKSGNIRPDFRRITYKQSHFTFAANLFAQLVNQTEYAIDIHAVESSYLLLNSKYISTVAGATFVPWQIPDPDLDQIYIYYDVYDCNGANYWVLGQNNEKVYFPTYMILFHELSHAFHILKGLYKNGSDPGLEEGRAVDDENTFRPQHVNIMTGNPQPLPLRSAKYLGGCGIDVPTNQMKNPTQKKNSYCFISTAAFETHDAVQAVQVLKERFLHRSFVIHTFLSELIDQYYRFIPDIAREMRSSPMLKKAIKKRLREP